MHISSPSNQADINAGFTTNVGWKEWYSIPVVPDGKITAIGTSVLKATETFARTGELTGFSEIFVQPPFEFKIVNKFLTSFYFPGSPLVAMTCAFGGIELIKEAYAKAVEKQYLFGIFGDRILVI
jgi:S-adenosylmethionine:tRNA ribosyltransferase-isomerase